MPGIRNAVVQHVQMYLFPLEDLREEVTHLQEILLVLSGSSSLVHGLLSRTVAPFSQEGDMS